MGKAKGEIESLYELLSNQVASLNIIWKDYLALFYNGEDNISILNRSGASFFCYLQLLIFEDIILRISKLMDNKDFIKKGITYENLSLECFNYKLKENSSFDISQIQKLENEFKILKNKKFKKFEQFEQWRNRRITHNSLKYFLNKDGLPSLPYNLFLEIITDINNYFRLYEKLLNKDDNTKYEESYSIGDANLLLSRLKFANDYDKFEIKMNHFIIQNIFEYYVSFDECKNLTIKELLHFLDEKMK